MFNQSKKSSRYSGKNLLKVKVFKLRSNLNTYP
nr:MAG TPA: hypothetical protein [Caudoviricetes sp.]